MAFVSALRDEIRNLKEKLNNVDTRFAAEKILSIILSSLLEFYTEENVSSSPMPQGDGISLLNKYFAIDEKTKECINLGDIEDDVESLWLGRMDSFILAREGRTYEICLHPSQLSKDRPLPILILDTGEKIPIIRRVDERTHIFLQQHRPKWRGLKCSDKTNLHSIDTLAKSTNFAFSSEVYILKQHEFLSKIVQLWIGKPDISASLCVDTSCIRKFWNEMKGNPSLYLHLVCTGQDTLFIHLCLSSEEYLGQIEHSFLIGHASC